MEGDDVAEVVAEFGTRVEDLRTLANHLVERAGDGTGDTEADEDADGAIDDVLVTGMEIGGICASGVVGCGVNRSGVCCSSCIGDSASGTTLAIDGEACSRIGEVRSNSAPPPPPFPTVTLRGLGVRVPWLGRIVSTELVIESMVGCLREEELIEAGEASS